MILRVVYASVLQKKQDDFKKYINESVLPKLRSFPGVIFVAQGFCNEEGHENEAVFITGWKDMESADAFENAPSYKTIEGDEDVGMKSFYTHRYQEHGATHAHYETFAVALNEEQFQ